MTRANESDRQAIERARLDRIRPPMESLSEIERAMIELHRSPRIVRDDPKTCRDRLRALGVAVELSSRSGRARG